MGKRDVQYDLHILATATEPEERYYYDDPAKAVIAYNRLACERRRRGVLSKTGHLPGMEAEIVGNYVPDDEAPPVTRPIRVRLGEPQPAFPRERERSESGVLSRTALESLAHAARWYAYGVIDAVGALSPFRREEDSAEFAKFHRDKAAEGSTDSVMDSWTEFAAAVRAERGL